MEIDPIAFAKMIAWAFCLGAMLELFMELLRFLGTIFVPRLKDTSSGSGTLDTIILAVRDIIFFFVCGIAFSIFIYWTNYGRIRMMAVIGVIAGFAAVYFTVGRLVRKALFHIVNIIHISIRAVFYPVRIAVSYLVRCGARFARSYSGNRAKQRQANNVEDI